ncbi:MAG: SDR family oxidoreductase [Phycisphaerales bacterium]
MDGPKAANSPVGPPVLVIGATGVVGRPIVRGLHARGIPVRVMGRDRARAAAASPAGVSVVQGDLADIRSLRQAAAGCRAVVTAVANPLRRRRPRFDPDREGMANLVTALRSIGRPHLVRVSAIAIEAGADDWWAASNKLAADDLVATSDLPFTILRPTWFIESLGTTAFGPVLGQLPAPADRPLWWIAGADFAALVANVLAGGDRTRDRILDVQGAESLSVAAATRTFARAWRGYLVRLPGPRPVLDLAGRMVEAPAYLGQLLDYTFTHVAAVPRDAAAEADAIHRPTLTVADTAADMFQRGDLPRKRLA